MSGAERLQGTRKMRAADSPGRGWVARFHWWGATFIAMAVLGLRPYGLARIGIGWDADLPLRPWPAVHAAPLPSGWEDWTIAWCGMFFGVTTPPRGVA